MYVCGIYYNTTYITINLFLQERTGFIMVMYLSMKNAKKVIKYFGKNHVQLFATAPNQFAEDDKIARLNPDYYPDVLPPQDILQKVRSGEMKPKKASKKCTSWLLKQIVDNTMAARGKEYAVGAAINILVSNAMKAIRKEEILIFIKKDPDEFENKEERKMQKIINKIISVWFDALFQSYGFLVINDGVWEERRFKKIFCKHKKVDGSKHRYIQFALDEEYKKMCEEACEECNTTMEDWEEIASYRQNVLRMNYEIAAQAKSVMQMVEKVVRKGATPSCKFIKTGRRRDIAYDMFGMLGGTYYISKLAENVNASKKYIKAQYKAILKNMKKDRKAIDELIDLLKAAPEGAPEGIAEFAKFLKKQLKNTSTKKEAKKMFKFQFAESPDEEAFAKFMKKQNKVAKNFSKNTRGKKRVFMCMMLAHMIAVRYGYAIGSKAYVAMMRTMVLMSKDDKFAGTICGMLSKYHADKMKEESAKLKANAKVAAKA